MATPNEDRDHQNQEFSENLTDGQSTQPQRPTYQNAREYAQALRPWLWQYYNSYAMQMPATTHFAYTNTTPPQDQRNSQARPGATGDQPQDQRNSQARPGATGDQPQDQRNSQARPGATGDQPQDQRNSQARPGATGDQPQDQRNSQARPGATGDQPQDQRNSQARPGATGDQPQDQRNSQARPGATGDQPRDQRNSQARPGATGYQPQEPQGVMLRIPTFSKRAVAELIDFIFLFFIERTVSFCLMKKVLGLDQLSSKTGHDIFNSFTDLDYDGAYAIDLNNVGLFAIAFEVIALPIINRILIILFETMCICSIRENGVSIGATPGKRMMGLRVVSCDIAVVLNGDRVRVHPAGNVSFKNALLRSVIKNVTFAFFLPLGLTLFFFKHNRTAYDVVSQTIVVEDRA